MRRISPISPFYNHRIFQPSQYYQVQKGNLRKFEYITSKKKISPLSPPRSSIIGMSKILDRNKSWAERSLWLIVLVIVSVLCCMQLLKCITTYFNNPVIKQTDLIRLATVKFPTISICPSIFRQLLHIFNNLVSIHCPDNTFTCFSNDSYEQAMLGWFPRFNNSTDALTLWTNEFADAMDSKVKFYTSCRKNEGNCEVVGREIKINHSTIDTFWGKCLIYHTAKDVEYKGPFTYITLQFRNHLHEIFSDKVKKKIKSLNDSAEKDAMKTSLKSHKIGLLVSVHGNLANLQKHFLFYLPSEILQGFETHMLLRRQQIKLLNRNQSPCIDEKAHFECYNACFEDKMSNICNPPFFQKPGLKRCLWNEDTAKTFLQNVNVYTKFNFTMCNCPPPCKSIRYITYTDVIDRLPDKSMIKVKFYFSDAAYDKMSEKYSYEFTSCLSDFGGSLGFFLGFSILNIVEIVDLIIHSVMKFF